MIKVESLSKTYGERLAVDNISFTIGQGEIVGFLGPNGAGKTTTFNMITGHVKPSYGRIHFDGQDITNLRPHQAFHLGIVRTFQIPRPFSGMTVLENLTMVPGNQIGENVWNNWLRRSKVENEELRIQRKAHELLEFLNLSDPVSYTHLTLPTILLV